MRLQQHALPLLLGWACLILNWTNASELSRDMCPTSCFEAGFDRSNWTVIAEFAQLQACQRPMVLDFSLDAPVTHKQHIRVCNVYANDFDSLAGSNSASSQPEAKTEPRHVIPELSWTPATSENEIGGRLVIQSVEHLQSYLAKSGQIMKQTILFATVSEVTAGVYLGSNLLDSSVAEGLFSSFLENLYITGIADSKSALVQVCEDRSRDDIFGLIAASSADFSTVHDAVGRWSNGSCVDTSSYLETRELNATEIVAIKPEVGSALGNSTTKGVGNSTGAATAKSRLQARADCRTVTVDTGDDCGKLLTRCGGGLTAADFYKYNPNPKLCSTLQPGQRVCCNTGQLPDIRPKQNADGSCFAYKIKSGDFCNKIASANDLTVNELEDLNKETWGAQSLFRFFFCFLRATFSIFPTSKYIYTLL